MEKKKISLPLLSNYLRKNYRSFDFYNSFHVALIYAFFFVQIKPM